jgi:ribonuclease BN (tRNA processing enzyme)
MKIIFLGVGEAFDKDLPNNSHLLVSDKTNLLVDCGFTIPWQLWKFNEDPNLLDAVYISHRHGDHFLGLPALFLRMWEGGRKRDLTVFCQKDFKEEFGNFMEFVYKGFQKKFEYKINLIESTDGGELVFNDLSLSFQKTIHSGDNLAVKITDGKNIYAYSGDGSPVQGTDFYKNLDLAILETYLYDTEKVGHSSIVGAIKFAEANDIKCLALTHINRDFRKNELPKIKDKIMSDKVKIIIPEPLEEYNF